MALRLNLAVRGLFAAPVFTGDGASVGGGATIRPMPGLMVLFPSRPIHRLRPCRVSGPRISVAFDVSLPA